MDLKAAGAGSPAALHAVIESIKISKADIYRYVADPAFTKVPTPACCRASSPLRAARCSIPAKAIAYPPAGTPEGGADTSPRAAGPAFDEHYDAEQHTTSFSIVDRFGNAVGVHADARRAVRQQRRRRQHRPAAEQRHAARLDLALPHRRSTTSVPGKIPILNNSPVVVLKDGKLAFVFGTPGGETIGQTEFQVLLNLVDFEMPVQEAIEAPRLALNAEPNFYKPGAAITVQIEGRVAAKTIDALKAMGHTVQRAARLGQPGPHAGDSRRRQDRSDDRRRRSAAHRLRDGLLSHGFLRAARHQGPRAIAHRDKEGEATSRCQDLPLGTLAPLATLALHI